MPTHSQLAAQLLRDAAGFFQTIGEQNEPLRAQMMENAAVFTEVAMLVETDPLGDIQGNFVNGGEGEGGGCCGGHGHHHGHDHGHDHSHDEPCADEGKKEGCDSKGGCGCH